MADQSPPKLSPHQGYQVKDWSGHDLYDCDHCPFDTMDADIMHQHQEAAHGRQQTMTAVDPRQPRQQDKE